ncbi:flagellar basal body protein [Paraclostridium benzoelyticum]|uniref:flagellar basal body protein n=1 Tax=Paraclostridium benzoelyticum TaxID=1629550 RepID=UPI0031CCE9B6
MSGLLGSLQSARTGMGVSQASIQTTSHNINNLNTPGYSRQQVEQKARSAYSYPGYNSQLGAGQLGTGVEITDIVRVRNSFYDFQFRNESHTYGQIGVKYDHYSTMETIFNEPSETGISSSINNFFMSWQELSKILMMLDLRI